jgi:DNA polymerase III sliding clamp (beta) subunit (PCNA family)
MARRSTKAAKPEAESTKLNRQSFIDALSKVKPGLANKEIVEQSTHFIFDNDKVWTYNDQITIMQNFQSGLKGAVKADNFFKLLNKIPDEEISMSSEEGKIKISGKKIKANIKIDPDIKIQPIPVAGINDKRWEDLPENFGEAIAFSAFSASRNMIRPELTCLYVTGEYVIGCDTFRGTKYKLKSEMKQTFLLPATAAIDLAKYNPYKVLVDEAGWLHFVNRESTTFSCRTYDIEYPEQIWKFFEVEGEEIILPEGFIDAVSRAEVLLTADFDLDRIVTLAIGDNQVICSSEGNYGDFEETADIKYDGEKLEIKVHPILLGEILKHLATVIVGDRLLFKGENFDHGICLSI